MVTMSFTFRHKRLNSEELKQPNETLRATKHPRLNEYGQNQNKCEKNLVVELIKDINETDNEPYIDLLSDEVVMLVFFHLDMQSLCRCSVVCKKWNYLSRDNFLWWNICKQRRWKVTLSSACNQQNWKEFARKNIEKEQKTIKNWKQRLGSTIFLDRSFDSDNVVQSCLVTIILYFVL
jgi:hypothetical protein